MHTPDWLGNGSWDTPQHVIIDDVDAGGEQSEIWPGPSDLRVLLFGLMPRSTGKDYSNPRLLDFHTLNKPEEDMYDRTRVPRMPWYAVFDPNSDVFNASLGMMWVCKSWASPRGICVDTLYSGLSHLLMHESLSAE